MSEVTIGKRIVRKLIKTTLGERYYIEHFEDLRTKERFGLIPRSNYMYGMLRAADTAQYFGHNAATVIEFGVADGAGLRNMISLAALIERETGVKLHIVGFDTGAGLPQVVGYKDHSEIWNAGDFTNVNKDALLRDIEGKAEIVWGDITHTIKGFMSSLKTPIGFISVDVDIYSATKAALTCLTDSPEKYLPAISMYFDDVAFFFANRWAGELLAISEFNDANALRKIDVDRSLLSRPSKAESWYQHMYVCHIHDHPRRQAPAERSELTIAQHLDFMQGHKLF